MTDDSTSRTLQLPDGRRLGYAEFGDPGGHPLVYFHGLPGSRRECGLLHDAARALHLRVVAPDRPGYGLSDPQPERRLSLWPTDVAALADALQLGTFSVIGVSGGGPCALACSALIPQRIARAAVVCGLGPLDQPALLGRMSWISRLAFHLPPAALAALYGAPLKRLARSAPRLAIRALGWRLGAPDRTLLSQPAVASVLADNLREAFRQGYAGALQDVCLYRRRWDFALPGSGVALHFWHGDADRIVPLCHGQYLHARVPGSQLTVMPGEGHFSLPIRHTAKILQALIE